MDSHFGDVPRLTFTSTFGTNLTDQSIIRWYEVGIQ